MQINGITQSIQSPYTVGNANGTATFQPAPTVDAPASGQGGAHISRRGRFLAKLQELEQSDPAQAKQMLTDLAQKIRKDPNSANDPRRQDLAARLEQAASTGDLSGLFPQRGGARPPAGPGGEPPSLQSGVAQYAATAATTRSSW